MAMSDIIRNNIGFDLIKFVYIIAFFFLCLLGRGMEASSLTGSDLFAPLQLPFTGPRQSELTTRKACVFWWYSTTLGLSLVPPLCLWQPKKFSNGSWHMLLLRNASLLFFTSGRENIKRTRPVNDLAVKYIIIIIGLMPKVITIIIASYLSFSVPTVSLH